jgi:hypothetical protein
VADGKIVPYSFPSGFRFQWMTNGYVIEEKWKRILNNDFFSHLTKHVIM